MKVTFDALGVLEVETRGVLFGNGYCSFDDEDGNQYDVAMSDLIRIDED